MIDRECLAGNRNPHIRLSFGFQIPGPRAEDHLLSVLTEIEVMDQNGLLERFLLPSGQFAAGGFFVGIDKSWAARLGAARSTSSPSCRTSPSAC